MLMVANKSCEFDYKLILYSILCDILFHLVYCLYNIHDHWAKYVEFSIIEPNNFL